MSVQFSNSLLISVMYSSFTAAGSFLHGANKCSLTCLKIAYIINIAKTMVIVAEKKRMKGLYSLKVVVLLYLTATR